MTNDFETTISVDPGIGGTGYAIWNGHALRKVGIITSNRVEWIYKALDIAAKFNKICSLHTPVAVFIEEPAFFQSGGGQVTAKSGALVKLSCCVGAICAESAVYNPELISVNRWKGQLKKTHVETRIRCILGQSEFIRHKIKSHAIDAVGVGLYVQGRF